MAANQDTRLKYYVPRESLWQNQEVLETLKSAADAFVKHVDGNVQIWASSLDWFQEEWGRDTFISLPGILLVTGGYDEARNNIRNFAGYERNGLIPNRILPESVEYNSADGPMWFIQAVKSYLSYTGDSGFVREILPVLSRIVKGYRNGTSYKRFGKDQIIKMDDDGLIVSPAQASWMDADPSGKGQTIVISRNGKTVEINALWYSNLRFLAQVERYLDTSSEAQAYDSLADKVRESFNKKFWNPTENALYDVIEGYHHQGAIRPNMLIAVSHGGDLLPEERQRGVFYSAKTDLLTPGGLRTLSPRDSNYRGEYDTSQKCEQKDWAYHQGTVWPWLMGPYFDTLAIVHRNDGFTKEQIRNQIDYDINPLVRFCRESPYKSLPEVFSGDPPYLPGGTRSQAWSVAEVLRILVEHEIIQTSRCK